VVRARGARFCAKQTITRKRPRRSLLCPGSVSAQFEREGKRAVSTSTAVSTMSSSLTTSSATRDSPSDSPHAASRPKPTNGGSLIDFASLLWTGDAESVEAKADSLVPPTLSPLPTDDTVSISSSPPREAKDAMSTALKSSVNPGASTDVAPQTLSPHEMLAQCVRTQWKIALDNARASIARSIFLSTAHSTCIASALVLVETVCHSLHFDVTLHNRVERSAIHVYFPVPLSLSFSLSFSLVTFPPSVSHLFFFCCVAALP
jgi:hypothetical protein